MKAYTGQGMFRRWWHLLFQCPTFWAWRTSYECPYCGKCYRCYWDGHDVDGYGTNLCGRCAEGIGHFRKAHERF